MFPHPNLLPRWLHRLLLISGAALLLTGLCWEAVHYTLGGGRGAQALPHASEAWLMRLHGAGVLAFTLALGALGPVHIPRGWRQRRNWISGLFQVGFALALLLSGYALSYFTDDSNRSVVGLLHAAIGVLMALVLIFHVRKAPQKPPPA